MNFRKFRQWLSVAFALLLTISFVPLSVSADIEQNTGVIKVTGTENGVTVNAYRILDVTYDYNENQPVEPLFTWTNETAPWIRTNYPAFIDEGNVVTEAFSEISDNDAATFYDKLAAGIRGGNPAMPVAATKVADSSGAADLTGLPMGNYLVLIENGFNVYRPSAVNLIPTFDEDTDSWKLSEALVELKSSKPVIDKKVSEGEDVLKDSASAGIGETVTYTLTADVPVYPANALAKEFVISDTLPAELTLNGDSIKVTGIGADGSRKELKLSDAAYYTQDTVRPGSPAAVTFALHFNVDLLKDFAKVEVVYTAVVNENAATGKPMENTADLDYSNNPYDDSSYETSEDKAKLYTFGIELLKHKQGQEAVVLPGAQFNLSATEDNQSPIAVVKTGDGTYRVATAEDAETTTILQTNAQGKITIIGLDEGDWYLTEIKAPDGYVKLSTPVKVTITADRDLDELTGGVVVSETETNADGMVHVKVENREGFTLPHTGGMGTIVFTAGGILLIALGAVIFFRSFRNTKA